MPLSPEMERLRKAAGSDATEEAAVLADAAAELESTAAAVTAYAAFSRAAGIDPAAVVTAPEATAQAFSRELSDLKAAQSALPKVEKPSPREFYATSQLAATKRKAVLDSGKVSPADLAAFEKRFMPAPLDFASVSLSRDSQDGDGRTIHQIDTLVSAYDGLLEMSGFVPPKGTFSAGREAPRQSPENGSPSASDAEAAGLAIGQQFQADSLAQRGLKPV